MMGTLLDRLKNQRPGSTRGRLFYILIVILVAGDAILNYVNGTYGPYEVTGYNYTDRHISRFLVDGQGAGSSAAHESGGGGGFYCCIDLPKHAKTLHITVELEWTKEQYEKHLPHDMFETDIPMPSLPNKHDGFIEFHFLPNQRVEATWVEFPTTPNIANAH